LRQMAADIYDRAQSLNSSVDSLHQSSKFGAAAEQFQAEYDHIRSQLNRLAEDGDRLGSRVDLEAEEWEGVDQDGAARLQGLFPAFLSGNINPALISALVAGGGGAGLAGTSLWASLSPDLQQWLNSALRWLGVGPAPMSSAGGPTTIPAIQGARATPRVTFGDLLRRSPQASAALTA